MATSVPKICQARDVFFSWFRQPVGLLVAFGVLVAACSDEPAEQSSSQTATQATDAEALTATTLTATTVTATTLAATTTSIAVEAEPESAADTRPDWLGTRSLPTLPDGRVVTPQTTPPELIDRRLVTVDVLQAPQSESFTSTIEPVPEEVLNRSTWVEGCPVQPEELRYLTLSFWGFDGRVHAGEMIAHESVADDLVTVFSAIFDARFPIEEMRVVSLAELDAEPTGDGNNTTAFVCRPVVGGTSFSQHAFGLAVDINPFHNPYIRNDLLLPELAGTYLERDQLRDGMVSAEGPVVTAFTEIGWGWGGAWNSLKDYQHFSQNNR